MKFVVLARCALIGAAALTASVFAQNDARVPARLGLPSLPAQHHATPAQIELGRKLFMDRRLSPNNTMACAMCHIPEQGFVANELSTAVGINGRSVKRNAPTILNVAYNTVLFWDGRETSLENLVWAPLLHPKEMGNASVESVIAKLNSLADYSGAFERVFDGERASRATVSRAVAAFQRTLIAGDSRFDRWYYAKDETAFTAQEQRGFEVFNAAGCAACHRYDQSSALFTDQRFHNTGIGWAAAQSDKTYTVPLAPGVNTQITAEELKSISDPVELDQGRFETSGKSEERYQYRTPSLRNVALTAPYMHDGSLKTLNEVVAFYQRGGIANPGRDALLRPFALSADDAGALVAFLRALTSAQIPSLAKAAREGVVRN